MERNARTWRALRGALLFATVFVAAVFSGCPGPGNDINGGGGGVVTVVPHPTEPGRAVAGVESELRFVVAVSGGSFPVSFSRNNLTALNAQGAVVDLPSWIAVNTGTPVVGPGAAGAGVLSLSVNSSDPGGFNLRLAVGGFTPQAFPVQVHAAGTPPGFAGTVAVTGNAVVGLELTADLANLGGTGVASFQWQRGAHPAFANIIGATGRNYVPTEADAGQTLRVVVSRQNQSGSVASLATLPVSRPGDAPIAGTVTIDLTEDVTVGDVITADVNLTGGTLYAVQWQRGRPPQAFVNIPGGTGPSYTVRGSDHGYRLRAVVTATGFRDSLESRYTDAVEAPTVAQQIAALRALPVNQRPATWRATVHAYMEQPVAPQTLDFGPIEITLKSWDDDELMLLSLDTQGAMFTVGAGVTLKVENVALVGTGFFEGQSFNNSPVVAVQNGGEVHLLDHTLILLNVNFGLGGGGGVSVADGGRLEIAGGIIEMNAALDGGGIFNSGTVIIYGGEIAENIALYSGGGIFNAPSGNVVMHSGMISHNDVPEAPLDEELPGMGGGVLNLGRFEMRDGSVIVWNEADEGGGVSNWGYFYMLGGSLGFNIAYFGGGMINDGRFELWAGQVGMNLAMQGAGIFNGEPGTFAMLGGSIVGNGAEPFFPAPTLGGGILNYGNVYLHGGEISNNYTWNNWGGGIAGLGSGRTFMSDTVMANNRGGLATGNGIPGSSGNIGRNTLNHAIDIGRLGFYSLDRNDPRGADWTRTSGRLPVLEEQFVMPDHLDEDDGDGMIDAEISLPNWTDAYFFSPPRSFPLPSDFPVSWGRPWVYSGGGIRFDEDVAPRFVDIGFGVFMPGWTRMAGLGTNVWQPQPTVGVFWLIDGQVVIGRAEGFVPVPPALATVGGFPEEYLPAWIGWPWLDADDLIPPTTSQAQIGRGWAPPMLPPVASLRMQERPGAMPAERSGAAVRLAEAAGFDLAALGLSGFAGADFGGARFDGRGRGRRLPLNIERAAFEAGPPAMSARAQGLLRNAVPRGRVLLPEAGLQLQGPAE